MRWGGNVINIIMLYKYIVQFLTKYQKLGIEWTSQGQVIWFKCFENIFVGVGTSRRYEGHFENAKLWW